MKVGVVILNWNGRQLLEQFLPSVVAHSGEHTIYVADNASTDDSIDFLQAQYPQVSIIRMKENTGYAGGYNLALLEVEEELVCLLNNDIEVTAGWINPIVQLFEKNPSMAACQPVLMDYKHLEFYEYAGAAGGYLDQLAYPYCRGRIFNHLERFNDEYGTTLDLDWASGAALFVKKKAYYEVGGLDDNYFAHQEEIDLCWRLRHAGYNIGISSSSFVRHLGGGTLDIQHPRKTFYNFRNSLFNIVKNDHGPFWLVRLLLRMVLDAVAGIRFLFKAEFAHFFSVLKAHGSFYTNLIKMLKKRQVIKRFSVCSTINSRPFCVVYDYFVKNISYYKDL